MLKKKLFTAALATGIILLISGCGGGGSSAEHIVKGEMAKITDSNKDDVAASAFETFNTGDDIENDLNLRKSNSKNNDYNLLNAKIIANYKIYKHSCESGNIEADDQELTIQYNNCTVGAVTINGKVKYYSTPSQNNIDAKATNLRVSIEGVSKSYYEYLILKKKSNYFQIKGTGYVKNLINNSEMKFVNLNYLITNNTYTIDGSITTHCLAGKWIDIKTKKALVKAKNYKDCPDAGDIEIKGKNSLLELSFYTEYNQTDGYYEKEEYNITLNDNTQSYNNCLDFEDSIKSNGCKFEDF